MEHCSLLLSRPTTSNVCACTYANASGDNNSGSTIRSATVTSPKSIKTILQFNCNGLQSKTAEVVSFTRGNKTSVTAIHSSSSLQSQDEFNVLRRDRPRSAGGGIALILHNAVHYRLGLLSCIKIVIRVDNWFSDQTKTLGTCLPSIVTDIFARPSIWGQPCSLMDLLMLKPSDGYSMFQTPAKSISQVRYRT